MTLQVKTLIAGNWKMNGLAASLGELDAMAAGFDSAMRGRLDLLVCVPATLLAEAARRASAGGIAIGAQDCHAKASGAHTGGISAEMIADCGASAVIVGHSERRTGHGETDPMVRAKAEAAQRAKLLPVICIGETQAERASGATLGVLKRQLAGSLPDNPGFVVAYEPVWAIGTGLTPSTDDIVKAHAFLRSELVGRFGNAGNGVRLLYGGSVKPSNAAEILGLADVNGALVGGASLKAEDFLAICAAVGK